MIIHKEGVDESIANSAELQYQRPNGDICLWTFGFRFPAIGLCKCLKSSSQKMKMEDRKKGKKINSSKQERIFQ